MNRLLIASRERKPLFMRKAKARRMKPSTRVQRLFLVACLLVASLPLSAEDEFSALREPTRDLAQQILEGKGKKVAVVDFSDLNGRVLEVGRAIAEEVAAILVREGKPLQVVDRLSMAALLQEHQQEVLILQEDQVQLVVP